MRIAKILKADNVLIAKAYYAKKKGKSLPDNPYNWQDSTIVGILERMDYCGYTVNFKSYSKSHKLKKRIPTTKEQQAIFRDTHEAIVEEAVFERVQELKSEQTPPHKSRATGNVLRLSIVRIAGVNFTLLPARVLTARKTITAVQDTKVIREIVRRISSEKKSYGKSFSIGYLP